MRLLCILGLFAVSRLAFTQDFSADVVSNKQGNQAPSKLYSTKDRARWELQGQDARMGPSAVIVDQAQGKFFILMTQRHMYMDSMPGMAKSPLITEFWHVHDVDDACTEWKKTAEQWKTDKNWGSCTKVGSDTVNGRSAVKYEGTSTSGSKSYYWVDTKLKCVIKTDSGSGSFELRNIQEGSQPASLFEVPSGYTKFDMGSMMQQRQNQ